MKSFLNISIFILISQFCLSQTSELNEIKETFESFLRTNPLSGVSLLTNQDEYVPGDSIFYSTYFLNSDGSVPAGKIILSLRLIDPGGFKCDERYIAITEGESFGQIAIPDTISSGIYRFEIVQSHNASEIVLLRKDLAIVREFEIAESDYISFYPEGGTLVESVPNRLLVHATTNKKAVQIVDDKGLTESIVVLDSLGYGVLAITPDPGKSYFAITDKGRANLPEAKTDGISIQLIEKNNSANQFALRISRNSKYHQESINAFSIASGKVNHATVITFGDRDSLLFEIPIRFTSPGVSEFLLVSNGKEILSSRSFIGALSEVPDVFIKVDKANIFQRDSVTMDIQLKVLDQSAGSRASVSLANQNVFSRFRSQKYFTNSNLIRSPIAYPWTDILENPDEYNTWKNVSKIKLKGRAVSLKSGEPVPDSTTIYFYLQKNFMGYEAITKRNGFFELTFLFDFYGKDQLFSFAEHNGKALNDIKIIWEEDLNSRTSDKRKFEVTERSSSYSGFKQNQLLINNSFSFFNQLNNQQLVKENPNREFEDEFMGADVVINVGDYVVFPSMVDLVREVIPNLQYRNIKGTELIRVIFSNNLIKPTDDPLYIIDGFMTKDTKVFLSLKPADLISVKVVKDVYKLNTIGFLGKNGIVYVQSKKDKAISLGQDEHLLQVHGIIKPALPRMRNTKKGNDRIPDFRTTLYWNPTLKSRADGTITIPIRVSDDVGRMLLKISGVTDSGQPFYSEKLFQIEFKSGY